MIGLMILVLILSGKMERWKVGRLEGWGKGRLEVWGNGRVEECMNA
jgi:hypothetical protein